MCAHSPGGPRSSRSRPGSRQTRGASAGVHSSVGRPLPAHCGTAASDLGCPCSRATPPNPAASDGQAVHCVRERKGRCKTSKTRHVFACVCSSSGMEPGNRTGRAPQLLTGHHTPDLTLHPVMGRKWLLYNRLFNLAHCT